MIPCVRKSEQSIILPTLHRRTAGPRRGRDVRGCRGRIERHAIFPNPQALQYPQLLKEAIPFFQSLIKHLEFIMTSVEPSRVCSPTPSPTRQRCPPGACGAEREGKSQGPEVNLGGMKGLGLEGNPEEKVWLRVRRTGSQEGNSCEQVGLKPRNNGGGGGALCKNSGCCPHLWDLKAYELMQTFFP